LLLLSLFLLTPKPAAAATASRYQELHTAVRATGSLIPQIQQASKDRQDQMICLAMNIYHEIRGGSARDQWAVAFVTINRTKREAFKASTVCDVVWARSQFSWTVKSQGAKLPREKAAWVECQRKAALLLNGEKMNDPTNGSTHFWSHRINPGWTGRLLAKVRIGAHMFARLPGRS
jgi:N-acetylmuramoyl-L-alanine amidase